MSIDILTHDQVARFLRDNPEFFSHFPDLLAEIHVPHPHSGQAISIGERQVMLLRDKTRHLEIKLKELIAFAEENDAIGEKMHKLSKGLMRARSLPAALETMYLSLTESFAIPHVAVRLWGGPNLDMLEFDRVSEDIRVLKEGLSQPQCGHDAPQEVREWFGEAGPHLRSFALVPLREPGMDGLLVMASEDPARFYPEMGNLYLTWLSELSAAAFSRFL